MTHVERTRALARAALTVLERNRRRIDDLNVYPVPDGDTGTNMTLTVRAIVDALDATTATDRATLAQEVARAALLGARGNSGVILSQIVRGAADVLGEAQATDAATVARALRGASDAAYRAVRNPVEGTMLSVIRAAAEEADARASTAASAPELLAAVVRRADEALARTQEQLDVLRQAGVVDAGGAGVAELLRGIALEAAGQPLPEAPTEREELATDAIHQELSRYRYCTTFVIEGDGLDPESIEAELERLGDSLLVVGDRTALKVHVHTDEPGRALGIGTAVGTIDRVEIANMHVQTADREARLTAPADDASSAVVAVVAGAGNRRLFEENALGGLDVVEGGQSMNPSVADLVAAIDRAPAPEVVLLPNNSNVVLAAERAAEQASKPVHVVATTSIPAGLAALLPFDPTRDAVDNAEEMRAAADAVATGEVTVASRDVELNGLEIRSGAYLGLADGEPVAGGASFDEVAAAVVERLLAEPRGVLTLLTGADEPELDPLLRHLAERHPDVELDVQDGGQPHYPLLLAAE